MPELQAWQKDWPLKVGQVMDQTVWEAQKQRALDLAETHGYLAARFTEQSIALDLNKNSASISLVLDSGMQATRTDHFPCRRASRYPAISRLVTWASHTAVSPAAT